MRQSTTPVMHTMSTRIDTGAAMTSGRAGKTYLVGYVPLLRGDSASGRVSIDLDLAEMPRPLLNRVDVNAQAWFVPKSVHPQFSGLDEFMHSYQGENIRKPGGDVAPPAFFEVLSGADVLTVAGSEMFQTLGLHVPAGATIQTDLIDAFWIVYNFRLASHSKALTRRPYSFEDLTASVAFPPAFWPSANLKDIVPDYERALLVGNLDLDVIAGLLPIPGVSRSGGNGLGAAQANATTDDYTIFRDGSSDAMNFNVQVGQALSATMEGITITSSLADIDKARTTQAFAKLRAAYAGNDPTGFVNDDAIVATLMQGLSVPQDAFKRPILLDGRRVPVGFVERFATDGASLDASVSQGQTSVSLSINVPKMDVGGLILVTLEVVPERINERMSDEWLHIASVGDLPDALRDIQITEPVDQVLNRRIDALHTSPNGLYGFEPLNNKWNRMHTRLGGSFYQDDPENPFVEQRSGLWHSSVIDPTYSDDHYLCPPDFPHDVFSDTLADAWEATIRHSVTIRGLTLIGDVLHENSDDYEVVQGIGE